MVERLAVNQYVTGSSPVGRAIGPIDLQNVSLLIGTLNRQVGKIKTAKLSLLVQSTRKADSHRHSKMMLQFLMPFEGVNLRQYYRMNNCENEVGNYAG